MVSCWDGMGWDGMEWNGKKGRVRRVEESEMDGERDGWLGG